MRSKYLMFSLMAGLCLAGCSDDGPLPQPDRGADQGPGSDAGLIGCARVEKERASCTQSLPASFDSSTVLPRGCYRAAQRPILQDGVTLTLSAGVTIIFAEQTGIEVSEGRGLIAEGTQQDPICLTGEQTRRGFWNGLRLDSSAASTNKLDWVTVEYAGSTSSDPEGAAVKLTSDSRPVRLSISNTTLRESQGFGLWLVGSAELGSFAGNTLTRNTLGPASLDSVVVDRLDTASSYRGNDRDELVVRAYRIEKAATWKAIDVPYYLAASLKITAEWTLSSGTTLIMSKDSHLTITDNAAALNAEGTAEKPILIRGEKPARGFWGAVIFMNANNPRNRMSHVTVEHAGGGVEQEHVANVTLTSTGAPVSLGLSHCTLRESKGYGLSLVRTASLPIFEGNTLTRNTKGPVEADSEVVHQLSTSSSYTGNDVDLVIVRGAYVSNPVTWPDLGLPYSIEQSLKAFKLWKLAPGVQLIMAKDSYIFAGGDEAGVNAVGTSSKPILITGAIKTPGSWYGIQFDNSNNAGNRFEHATLEYGGGGQAAGNKGMLHLDSDSHGVTVHVSNSTLRHSAGCAIYLGGNAKANTDLETSNTFSGNVANICHQP